MANVWVTGGSGIFAYGVSYRRPPLVFRYNWLPELAFVSSTCARFTCGQRCSAMRNFSHGGFLTRTLAHTGARLILRRQANELCCAVQRERSGGIVSELLGRVCRKNLRLGVNRIACDDQYGWPIVTDQRLLKHEKARAVAPGRVKALPLDAPRHGHRLRHRPHCLGWQDIAR